MNGVAVLGDQMLVGTAPFAAHNCGVFRRGRRKQAMIETMAFVVAVGGVATVCYLLVDRAERRAERRTSSDSSGSDGGNYVGGADSWTAFTWFGGFHSSGGSFDSGELGATAGAAAVGEAINPVYPAQQPRLF